MIKCALCGAEWKFKRRIAPVDPMEKYWHPESDCPLACVSVLHEADISAINSAIEAAKADKRKPEECAYYRDPLKNASFCLLETKRECQCPCAAWRKEKC